MKNKLPIITILLAVFCFAKTSAITLPKCLTLHFQTCVCGVGGWLSEGCNDLGNGKSLQMSGLFYFHYAFSATDSWIGWKELSDFPYQEDYITCFKVDNITGYNTPDCTGEGIDFGPSICNSESPVRAYYFPLSLPNCIDLGG